MALFKTSKKSAEKKSSDKKSEGGIFDPSHDFVRFEGADGKSVMVPRGSMSDEDWKDLVSKSTQKATFKEAKVGKQIIKSPEETEKSFHLGPVDGPVGEGQMVDTKPYDAEVGLVIGKDPAGADSRVALNKPFEGDVEPFAEVPYKEEQKRAAQDAEMAVGAFEEPSVAKIGTEDDPPAHPTVKRLPDVPVQPYGIQSGGEELRRRIGSAVESGGQLAAEALGSPAAMGFMGGFQKGLAHPIDSIRELSAEALRPSPGAKLQQLTDAGKKGLPPPAKTPSGPPPASPTDTPSTSNSNSLSVSVRGGPGGSPPRGTNQLDQAQRDFLAGQERQQQDAFNTANAQLQAREEHARKMRDFEVRQNEEKLSQRKAEDDLNNAYRTTLDELGKKMQIDPNHFWESKSTGQQVGIAIGAFLAGIGGRSPAALIDSMVQQDIAVQRENFNLAREGLKGKLAGLDNMYGKLRQRGLDDREAAAATRASINEGLARQMEGIAEQSVPGELQAKAQLALAEFRANKVRAEEELTTLRFNRWAKTQELQSQRMALAVEAAASAAKATAGKTIPPGVQQELARLEQGMLALDRIDELVKGPKKAPRSQLIDANSQAWRGLTGGLTDYAFTGDVREREEAIKAAAETAVKAVKGENILEADMERLMRGVPLPGLTANRDLWVKERRKELEDKKHTLIENLKSSPSMDTAPDPSLVPVQEQEGE